MSVVNDPARHIYNETINNTLVSGDKWYIHNGGQALANQINGGSMTVYAGGLAESTYLDSGSLYICSGGKHSAILDIDDGTVTVEEGGIIDFKLVYCQALDGEDMINDLSLINGTPTFTITTGTYQAAGTYDLAGGAYGLSGSVGIGSNGSNWGKLTINGDALNIHGISYDLNCVNGKLSLTISGSMVQGTVSTAVGKFFSDKGGVFNFNANGVGFTHNSSDNNQLSYYIESFAWELLGSGDFNNSGTDGLLWLEKGTGNVYMQNDMASFNEIRNKHNCLGNLGEGYEIIDAGDFTGTGFDGVVMQGPAFGDASVSLNYGLPIWGRESNGTMFAGWLGALVNTWQPGQALKGNTYDLSDINAKNYMYKVVDVGDYNGDGVDDVMLQNIMPETVQGVKITGSGDVFTFLTGDINAVKAGAAPTVAYAGCATGGWEIIGSGDFNGDGNDDAILSDGTGVAGWMMAGGQRWGDFWFGNLTADQEIAGITDLNNDGTDDIIVLNTSTDTYTGWLVENGKVISNIAIV